MKNIQQYGFDRYAQEKHQIGLERQISSLEKEKSKSILGFIERNKLFSSGDIFTIQWPNERVPEETFQVKAIRWGISNDSDSKQDLIYDCKRIIKKKTGRPSERLTSISHSSILTSRDFSVVYPTDG